MKCIEGQKWTSKAGWEEHLRQFVSSSRPSEEQEPNKDVLWIYVPDYEYNGRIMSIQNVTNWQTDYQPFFDSIDYIKEAYQTNETWQLATKEYTCWEST